MTTQTQLRSNVEALRLATALTEYVEYGDEFSDEQGCLAAAELRRLVSFNQQLMDEVARLNKVEDAAKNLVKVKGRYHTEQAFNKLKELVQ